jgi:methylated-DNA-[protein]-cysteine S-methyltransferase
MLKKFSDGPPIRVTLEFEALRFKRASLSFSDRFECDMEGNAGENLRDDLLTFLENYGKKNPTFVELDLEHFSPFRKKALSCLQKVAFGEVLTYGELAAKIDNPKAARAIGTTCRDNPYPLFIPCHRVIGREKRLGGFACDLKMKQLLLDFEDCYSELMLSK